MGDNKCAACGQWSGRGHKCPTVTSPTLNPTLPTPPSTGSALRNDVADRTASAAAYLAETSGSGLTKADVDQRMWEREQAERMGLDPDIHAGPVLFTDEEWEAMTGTREARIMFGYELPCGCRPGSCSSEYGGDCVYVDDYDYEVDDPNSVYVDPAGISTGRYANMEELTTHGTLLKDNFQKAEEAIVHQGFDQIRKAAPALEDMRQAFPIDYTTGPERVVEQMDAFSAGARRLLDDTSWINNPAWNDLWVAQQTASRIADRLKETYPSKFPVGDPWDPPF